MSNSLGHPQLDRCYDLALQGAWRHPFFLVPLGHVQWMEGNPEQVKTMEIHSRVVGKGGDAHAEISLHINTGWVSTLPDAEVFGVLCHEIMHSLMRHHERIGNRNMETWGKASDMAINSALVQSGVKLPSYALMPPHEHADLAAEELYELLQAEEMDQPRGYDPGKVGAGCLPKKGGPGSDDGDQDGDGEGQGSGGGDQPGEGDGDGEGEGSGGGEGESENDSAANRVWGEMIAQAQNACRGSGVAKVMARVFAPKPTKTKWARLLKSACARATARGGRDQQTYARINRRSMDIILPGWQSNRPSVAVMVDSSGSVSDDMLQSALTAVVECAKVSGVRIFLACHDWTCYYADWVKSDTTVAEISKKITQRGGTDPNGAFLAVGGARGKFDQCVYLTDGEVGQYPGKPDNVRNMIVGILGDRPGNWRATVPPGWTEIPVEL